MINTGIEEDIKSVLMSSFHSQISGGEVGGGECIPGRTSFEKVLDDVGVAVLGRVHKRSEALGVEIGHVGSGVYQSFHLVQVAALGGLA